MGSVNVINIILGDVIILKLWIMELGELKNLFVKLSFV